MGSRTYPKQPLVGVGAAVYKDTDVLLIRRGKPPLYGAWSLPGGRVKEDEDLKQALRREVREECSIEIEVGDLVIELSYIERDEQDRVKYHYVVFDFAAQYLSGTLARASDALQARWIPIEKLPSYDLTDKVREVIRDGAALRKTH
jgi:ADP-ribose pyrophosphatase YjhB (NUDIX family)